MLRKDTPEEHVRQRIARSLVEEYGYSRSDLHLEFPIKVGSARKRIDIAVFPEAAAHSQDALFCIVETKREATSLNDRKEGIAQLKSYMAACPNVRWGLWVGSEMQALERSLDPQLAATTPFLPAPDIPFQGEQEPRRLQFSELVPATSGLRAVFKRAHNYLHVNGNLGKEKAFFELLKLIFCKVHDEAETSGTLQFSITQEERRSELAQRKLRARIERLFAEVRENYPYIFPDGGERIDLDNRSLAYIVGELQKYNFQETPSDIKGEAYEEIVSVTSRRDHGAFFTPRNVCDLAVGLVFATYPLSKHLNLRILDPACGTGGFLRAALVREREVIRQQAIAKWGSNRDRLREDVAQRLRRVCDRNIFGVDKLAELVRAAQMNLAMHGDGSTNVFHANSLLPFGELPHEARAATTPASFDVVLTNPPFGSRLPIDDPHLLDQFELSRFEARAPRGAMPPEQLFIERCLDFLKPRGRMAIILPDSILSNPGLAYIRRWLLRRAYVLASVDLPRETFARSDTHTMTSILVLQRFTDTERALAEAGQAPEYECFMAIADHVGWDLRGNALYRRTAEGEEILARRTRVVYQRLPTGEVMETPQEEEAPVLNDHLPQIEDLFTEWLTALARQPWHSAP